MNIKRITKHTIVPFNELSARRVELVQATMKILKLIDGMPCDTPEQIKDIESAKSAVEGNTTLIEQCCLQYLSMAKDYQTNQQTIGGRALIKGISQSVFWLTHIGYRINANARGEHSLIAPEVKANPWLPFAECLDRLGEM